MMEEGYIAVQRDTTANSSNINENLTAIEKLNDATVCLVQACTALPWFHSFAEELIFNSLDANATKIDVFVDLSSLSVEVRDNGYGINLADLDGQVGCFGFSSRKIGSAYGYRGDSIASMRYLSSLSIYSFARNAPRGHIVNYGDPNAPNLQEGLNHHGTIVAATNIYHNLPVRQRSMNRVNEMVKIKRFIQVMSILHHNIEFRLEDITAGVTSTILNLMPQKSVAGRISCLYNSSILMKMTTWNISYGHYSLMGLISPPSLSACRGSKDCQHLFVNRRWIKGASLVSKVISDLYYNMLGLGSYHTGPVAMHNASAELHEQRLLYPSYVLEFNCPPENVDFLVEKDKSVVRFVDITSVLRCLELFFIKLIKLYSPDKLADASEFFQSKLFESKVSDSRTDESVPMITELVKPTKPKRTVNSVFSSCSVSSKEMTSQSSANTASLFEEAFVFPVQNISSCDSNHCDNACFDQSSTLEKLSKYCRQPEAAETTSHLQPVEFDPLIDMDPMEFPQTTIRVEVARNSVRERYYDTLISDGPIYATPIEDHRDRQTVPIPQFAAEPILANKLPNIKNAKCSSGNPIEEKYDGYFNASVDMHMGTLHQPSQIFEKPVEYNIPIYQPSKLVFSQSVEKMDLSYLSLIGQADRKYLVAVQEQTSKLFIIDQHAADERVHLESYFTRTCSCNNICMVCFKTGISGTTLNLSRPVEIIVDEVDMLILRDFASCIEAWGFQYFIPDALSGRQDSTIADCKIVVTATPIVAGESLNADDFLEYIRWLRNNPKVTPLMNKPPSVYRILCSKACKHAIKFGDWLSQEQCQKLLESLSAAIYPFQCAHGRPTCFPATDLKEILSHMRSDQLERRCGIKRLRILKK